MAVFTDAATEKKIEIFVAAINKETQKPVQPQAIFRFLNEAATIEANSSFFKTNFEMAKNDLKKLQIVKESSCSEDTHQLLNRIVEHLERDDDERDEIHGILVKLEDTINTLQQCLENTIEEMDQINEEMPKDLRERRGILIRILALKIKRFLQTHGNLDPDFWTGCIIFGLGDLPISIAIRDKDVRKSIEASFYELSFDKLNRKEGGEGFHLKRYIKRLCKQSK